MPDYSRIAGSTCALPESKGVQYSDFGNPGGRYFTPALPFPTWLLGFHDKRVDLTKERRRTAL